MTRRRVGTAAALALLPVVVLVALRASPYFRLNNGDPFIYVGYSNGFYSHVRRFGYTYHAVRFGLIFPLRMSLWLGPFWGYFVLRWLLYQLAIVPLWFALARHSRRAAAVAVVAFVASPVAAQSILTTYHDTIVVPCLTAMVSLLLIASRIEGRARLALYAGSGLLAGVAVHANVFAVALTGVAFLTHGAFLARQRKWRELALSAAIHAAGVLLVSGIGVLVYQLMFDDPSIFSTTINAVDDINSSEVWRSPSYVWLTTRRFVYPPFVALAVAWAVARRARDASPELRRTFWAAFASTAALLGFFLLQQFVLDGAGMEQAYYFSAMIGPTCLLLGATTAMVPWPRSRAWWLVPVAFVGMAFASQLLDLRWFVVFLIVVVGLVGAAVWRPAGSTVALFAFAAMSLAWGAGPRTIAPIEGAGFQYEPHYETVFGDASDTAFEAYMLATDLTHLVPTTDDVQPPLLFWYPTGDAMLDSVQSTYLWQTATVQQAPPGMPALGPEDRARLSGTLGGYVVLLARTEAEIAAGDDALHAAGFGVDTTMPVRRLSYDDSTVFVHVVPVHSLPA